MFLDEVRSRNGVNEMITFFGQLIEHDTEEAVNFINAEDLKFSTLFLLRNKIEETQFYQFLNLRNKIAINLILEMTADPASPHAIEESVSGYVEEVHATLLWMLMTGSVEDGMNDEYDEIMDKTAILLTKVYRDRQVMQSIADMIFDRNRKGLFYHDMVWAFFEARDPLSLNMLANKINSENTLDSELALRLLNFIPGINAARQIEKKKSYTLFKEWLKSNILLLHYTGESFQHTSKPRCYRVSEEGKYLCESVCIDNGKILKELTDEERKLLEEFRKLDRKVREILSNFSIKMHYEDFDLWKDWIKQSISKQINIAKSGGKR